jgi:peptidoglycan-N-acetylglucosamine deacetylase
VALIRLSFDDGPGPSTAELLDVLGAARRTATFFLLGVNLENDISSVTRMILQGHTIGNHTYSHARPGAMSSAALEDELEVTDALIHDAYRRVGRVMPELIPVRLPYGMQVDDPRLPMLQKLARPHVGWTAIFDDWCQPACSSKCLLEAMLRHIEDCVSQGRDALLCLHDSSRHRDDRPATVEAVKLLLESSRYQALSANDGVGC